LTVGVSHDSRADHPLVVLGPTASGKSTLALAIAGIIGDVELVSADSMQVYRGMDIGTASPSAADRAAVPHHLVDIVDPNEEFDVGEFQRLAREALADIRARGGAPVLVGGTGLYLRAVVDDLELPGRYPEVLARLEAVPDTAALHRRLSTLDPVAAERMEPTNRRRIVRALEVTIGSGRPFSASGPGLSVYSPTRFVQMALRWPRDELDARVAARYDAQMEAGFLAEVEALAAIGPSRSAAQALGYRELLAHVRGECSLDEALDTAIRRTIRFSRRQERWFRRDPRITWIDAPADAADVVRRWDDQCGNRT
jgi:tRNA dimethylallyltransferase